MPERVWMDHSPAGQGNDLLRAGINPAPYKGCQINDTIQSQCRGGVYPPPLENGFIPDRKEQREIRCFAALAMTENLLVMTLGGRVPSVV